MLTLNSYKPFVFVLFLYFLSLVQCEKIQYTNGTVLLPNSNCPSGRESQLIAIGANGVVWAINRFTGDKEWTFDTGKAVFSFNCPASDLDPFLLIPSSSGDLFTYSEGSLHHLGTTIQELVAGSPLTTSDGSYWMASKSSQMWALDINGNLVHSWSSSQPMERDKAAQAWDDILVLVQITYNLQSIDIITGELKWNISVSEFIADKADTESERPRNNFIDPVIISSDGTIFYYHEDKEIFQWKGKLPSGVVTTYELSQTNMGADGLEQRHWHLQGPPKFPILPPDLAMNLPSGDPRFPGIFIGINEGSLYAIPVSSYYDSRFFDLLGESLPHSNYPAIGPGDDELDDEIPSNASNNGDHALVPSNNLQSEECDPQSPSFPMCIIGFNHVKTSHMHLPAEIPHLPEITSHREEIQTELKWNQKLTSLLGFNLIVLALLILTTLVFIYVRQREHSQPKKPLTMPFNTHPPLTIGKLYVSDTILGHGSSGTIVYKGALDGREVAVKRMLLEYYQLAAKEIKMLQRSDEHPNVVRYYTHERDDNFMYLALSCCSMNLDQYIQTEKMKRGKKKKNSPPIITNEMLLDIVNGLCHVHAMKIIHRDLKPHNILVGPKGVLKISDMGLAKKLESDEHSFSTQTSTGTLGWQAPEQMIGKARQSNKVDVFALGCVIYYCITEGSHPFGDKTQRENNILNNRFDLSQAPDAVAKHLIRKMILPKPKDRIDVMTARNHPFFWCAEKTLDFFRLASDRVESEKSNAPIVIAIEGRQVLGCPDWLYKVDPKLRNELQTSKFRKYKGNKVRDLLRVIRNKTHHYRDLPPEMQMILGDLPHGFLNYWTSRFPPLLIETYEVICHHCRNEPNFAQFF